MSIDFSKVTALSDQYGNIVEVTDEAGNVLWSAVPAFDGFIYLRPSADISVDSTIALTPSTATAAYMLINEEVSDNGSTKIGVTASSEVTNVSGSARFSLDGYVPKTISRVIDFNVGISGDEQGSTITVDGFPTNGSGILVDIYINGIRTGCDFQADANSDMFQGAGYSVVNPIGFRRGQPGTIYEEVSKEVILAEINDYLTANGVLPNIELVIELDASYVSASGSSGKSSTVAGYAYVSQAYVVLQCE